MCLIPNTRCIIIAEHVKVSLFVIVFNLCKGNDIFFTTPHTGSVFWGDFFAFFRFVSAVCFR